MSSCSKSLNHDSRVARNGSGKYVCPTLCIFCQWQNNGLERHLVWPIKSVLLCSLWYVLVSSQEISFRSIQKMKFWFCAVDYTLSNVRLDMKTVFLCNRYYCSFFMSVFVWERLLSHGDSKFLLLQVSLQSLTVVSVGVNKASIFPSQEEKSQTLIPGFSGESLWEWL